MLESYTTLGYLAAATERVRLGTLVTGITYRNLAHLAKIVATLDVLSGGRAVCGLGAAWFEREHRALRLARSRRSRERYALLEDALGLLPLMWGPGAPRVRGPHDHRRRGGLLPAAAAGARPDPRRRVGRAADAAARRPARRRVQPVRRRRDACGARSACCTRTARPRVAIRPTIRVTHLAAARVIAARRAAEGPGRGDGRRARRPLPRAGRGRRADGDRRARRRRRPRLGARFAPVVAAFARGV